MKKSTAIVKYDYLAKSYKTHSFYLLFTINVFPLANRQRAINLCTILKITPVMAADLFQKSFIQVIQHLTEYVANSRKYNDSVCYPLSNLSHICKCQ